MQTLNNLVILIHLFVVVVVSFPLSKDPPAFNIAEDVYVTELYNISVCMIDGLPYEDGEIIPTIDPCESCICHPPGFACKVIKCKKPPKGCIEKAKKLDDCCPRVVCDDSLANNLLYRSKNENDTIEDDVGSDSEDVEVPQDEFESTEEVSQSTLLTSSVSKEDLVTSSKTEATTMLVNYSIKLIVDNVTQESNVSSTESSVSEETEKIEDEIKTPTTTSEKPLTTKKGPISDADDDVPETIKHESTTIIAEKSTIIAEESTITAEESTITAEKSTTIAEESTITAEKSTITAEKSTIPAEKSTITAEKTTETADNPTIIVEKSTETANISTIVTEAVVLQENNTRGAEISTEAISVDHTNEKISTVGVKISSSSEAPTTQNASEKFNKTDNRTPENPKSLFADAKSVPRTNTVDSKKITESEAKPTHNPVSEELATTAKASENKLTSSDNEKESVTVSNTSPEDTSQNAIEDEITQFIGIFEEITPIPDEDGIKGEPDIILSKADNLTSSENGEPLTSNKESNETKDDVFKPSGPIIFIDESSVTPNEHGMRPRGTENSTTITNETFPTTESSTVTVLEISTEGKLESIQGTDDVTSTNTEEKKCNGTDKSVELVTISKESVLPKEVLDALLDELAAKLRGDKGGKSKLETDASREKKLATPTTDKPVTISSNQDELVETKDEPKDISTPKHELKDSSASTTEKEKSSLEEIVKKLEEIFIPEVSTQVATTESELNTVVSISSSTEKSEVHDGINNVQRDEVPERSTEESIPEITTLQNNHASEVPVKQLFSEDEIGSTSGVKDGNSGSEISTTVSDTKLDLTTIVSVSIDIRVEDSKLEEVNLTQELDSETSTPEIIQSSPDVKELSPESVESTESSEVTSTTADSTEKQEGTNADVKSTSNPDSTAATFEAADDKSAKDPESTDNVDTTIVTESIKNSESATTTIQSIILNSELTSTNPESTSTNPESSSEPASSEPKLATQRNLELTPDQSTTLSELSRSSDVDLPDPTTTEPQAIVTNSKLSDITAQSESTDLPNAEQTTDPNSSPKISKSDKNQQEINKSQEEIKTTVEPDAGVSTTPQETQPTTQDNTSGGKFETTTVQITKEETTTLIEATVDDKAVKTQQQPDVDVKVEPTKYSDNSIAGVGSKNENNESSSTKKPENQDIILITSSSEIQKDDVVVTSSPSDNKLTTIEKIVGDNNAKTSKIEESTIADVATTESNHDVSTKGERTTLNDNELSTIEITTTIIENNNEPTKETNNETSTTDEAKIQNNSKVSTMEETASDNNENVTSSSTVAPSTSDVITKTTQPDVKTEESGFTSPWTVVMETIFSSVQPSSYDAAEERQ